MSAAILLALALSCGGKQKTDVAAAGTPADAVQVVEQIRQGTLPFALQGRFNLKISGPSMSGVTTGVLVLHNPERFRVEIYTPLKTPMIVAASDGKHLHVWSQTDNTFYRGDDAVSVLSELLGGQVAVADMLALVTGTLPLDDRPVLQADWVDGKHIRTVIEGPDGLAVSALLNVREGLVRELSVAPAGQPDDPLYQMHTTDTTRVGRSRLPQELSMSLPSLGWQVDMDFHTWDELGVIPDAFSISPPPGAIEKDLVTVLQDIAQKRRAAEGLETAP